MGFAFRAVVERWAAEQPPFVEEDPEDEPVDEPDDLATEEEPDDATDDAEEPEQETEQDPENPNPLGDPACPYCGNPTLSGAEDNGRATRLTCDTCGGSVVGAPGEQPMPDLIGSPHNHPSQQPDGRSGGVPGVSNGPQGWNYRGGARHTAAADGEQLAKHFEARHANGEEIGAKEGGFAGYVEPEKGFDDELRAADEEIEPGRHLPTPEHMRSIGHHAELGNFLSEQMASPEGNARWHQHGQVGPVDISSRPVYATQRGLSGGHLARYLRKPEDKTQFMHMNEGSDDPRDQRRVENDDYPGHKMPMFVHHQGNLYAVEGHHRTASALLRGESHVPEGITWDADKHGLPHSEDMGGEPVAPGAAYSGFHRYSSLDGIDCDHSFENPGEATRHAMAFHDDGICVRTHVRRGAPGMGDVLATRRNDDDELGFHLTASWRDVQDKATRIAREGGVHISVASNDGIGGTVRGDHDLYETMLTYVPGSRKVGYWTCGCKWASYAWGRSAPYRRFEGRMCSHALALQFEALKQHAFNRKQVEEHDFRPAWMRDKTVVVHHQRVTDRAPAEDMRRPASLLAEFEPAAEVPDTRAPVYAIALHGVLAGENPGFVAGVLGEFGASRALARALVSEAQAEAFQHTGAGVLDEFRREILMMERPDHAQGAGSAPHEDHHGPGQPQDNDEPEGDDQGDTDPESHQNNPLDPAHFTHKTEDAREHAPDFGWGVPADDAEITACPQCTDGQGVSHGCGHCGGTGQVDHGDHSQIPDQNADSGYYSKGKGEGGGGIPTFGARSMDQERSDFAQRVMAIFDAFQRGDMETVDRISTTADYSSYDWQGDPVVRQPNRHVNSDNPASTGWATGADPSSWTSMVDNSNNFDPIHGAKKGEPDVPTHAGVALKAHDTGRVLMLQRSFDDPKDPARGRWEFPGGGLEPGDKSTLHGGIREWEEETGHPFPEGGTVHHTWRSGPYQGHAVVIPSEDQVDLSAARTVHNPDDDSEQRAWIHPTHARRYPDLRDEVKSGTPWKQLESASLDRTAGLFSRDRHEPVEPQGGTPSPWEEHHPHTPNEHELQAGCARCGSPETVAYDSHHDRAYCREHIDEIQGSDRPIAEENPERARRGEPMATRLHPIQHQSIMHEQPEGALPTTEGDEDARQYVGPPGERYRDQMASSVSSQDSPATPSIGTTASSGSVTDIVAAFQASAGARALDAPSPTQGGAEASEPGGGDIASAAREHLQKAALKNFSPVEQRELIEEGRDGPRARNFGDLRIEGTHYAEIEDEEILT